MVISGGVERLRVDKQADLGRSGARDCGAPEWQARRTDADDGESSTVGDDMAVNGGGTTLQPSHSTTSVMGLLATPITHPTPP